MGGLRIAGLANEVGWSRRQLSQRFTAEYGIGPKQASRLIRFQRARDLIAHTRLSLAQVAVDTGYADQAHLTREFRELAGDPPSTWLREERPFIQDGR
jgi:transcriptional regulator GlxA family with amidase domain